MLRQRQTAWQTALLQADSADVVANQQEGPTLTLALALTLTLTLTRSLTLTLSLTLSLTLPLTLTLSLTRWTSRVRAAWLAHG